MAINTQTLTIEDFVQRYADDGPFELVDGEMIPVTPQVLGSGRTGGLLYRLVANYVYDNGLGEVLIETPFVITLDRSRWVTGSRVPDVMFYTTERFESFKQAYADWESIPVVGAPDFAAEIVSPTDSFTDVSRKVERYLDDGVKLIWAVDWQAKTIQARAAGSNQITTFGREDTISADAIIPGYELDLTQLFSP